jgi:hypothetical protein
MGGGDFRDPRTAHWWKDSTPRACGQILSPHEMGLTPRSMSLREPSDPHPRHPSDVDWWKLPACDEPVAQGYNPLRLCGLHLALAHEQQRKHGRATMPIGARGAGVSLDFVAPPSNLFFQNERTLAEVNLGFAELEKAERLAAAERNLARLTEEAAQALEASYEAREALAEAEGASTNEPVASPAPLQAPPETKPKKAKGGVKKAKEAKGPKVSKDQAAPKAKKIPRMKPGDERGSNVKAPPGQRELF